MALWKNIKGFLLKEDFDFDDPNINLYNFHPQLRIFYMINGIFFNNKESKTRFIFPIFNTLLGFVAIGFEVMFVFRGMAIKDYAFASESLCYVTVLGTVPIVYISTLYNRNIIVDQLEAMNSDIVYICKLSPKHREPFLQGQLKIWTLCWVWFAFVSVVCLSYIGNTFAILLYQNIIATQNEYQIRPLIFPMWLPYDDPYRTPNYEIFLFLQICSMAIIYQNFCVYVYTQFHFLLHYYNLMDMIILDLGVIFEDLDDSVADLPKDDPRRVEVQLKLNSRVKRIANWHKSVFKAVDTVSSVYGPPLVYQVVFSSFLICIIAYQIADHLERGIVHVLFAILGIAACIQLWIPCYLGTLIRDKAFSVGDECWKCGWQETKLGRMLCREIVLIILRAQQPLIIRFTGLPELTLETYSSIMSTSYSYFNMLRQSTRDK